MHKAILVELGFRLYMVGTTYFGTGVRSVCSSNTTQSFSEKRHANTA